MSSTDLTYLELQDEALHDDFSANKYRARCKGFINDWLGEIFATTQMAAADQEQTIPTVAGQRDYDLPATSVRVDSLRDTSSNPDTPLVEIDQDTFDQLPDSTGVPTGFVLREGQFWLWPTPSDIRNLELRFRGDSGSLAADDDRPAIPNKYRRILVYHARSELFALEDDPDMATFWAGKRDAGTSSLRADLQRRSRRTRRVPSMWAGRGRRGFKLPGR